MTLTAVDAYSEAPVQGAKLRPQFGTIVYCHTTGYRAFESATSGVCSFRPLGSSGQSPVTNAQGKIDLYLPKSSLMNSSYEYVMTVTHPMTNSRVTETRIAVADNSAMSVRAVIPGTPSVPEQPTVVAGDSKVTLNWSEPWNGGAFIDYYQTWYSLNAQGPFQRITSGTCAGNIPADRRECEVTDLVPGVTYYFAIIAHNVVGASGLSVAVASVPTGGTVTAPGGLPGAVPVDPNFAALSPSRQNALQPGRTKAMVRADGSVDEVRVDVAPGARALQLEAGSTALSLESPAGVSVGEDGVVNLQPASEVALSASGLEPGSTSSLLLVPNDYYSLSTSAIGVLSNQVLVLASGEVDASGQVSLQSTLEVAEGDYQLQLVAVSSTGELITLVMQANVIGLNTEPTAADSEPAEPRGWTRFMGDGSLKFYARDIVGAGKVRFVLNGREVAWVRATDATDPKLNVGPAAARDGLVRTVGVGSRWSLDAGRNVLEIYVGENRLVRRIFTQ